MGLTHAISFFSSVSNFSCLPPRRTDWRKTDAKVQPFSKPAKYFFTFLTKFFATRWFTTCIVVKKFSWHGASRGAKRGARGGFLRFSGAETGKTAVFMPLHLHHIVFQPVGRLKAS